MSSSDDWCPKDMISRRILDEELHAMVVFDYEVQTQVEKLDDNLVGTHKCEGGYLRKIRNLPNFQMYFNFLPPRA